MREIAVPLPGQDHSYQIVIDAGLRQQLGERLAQILPGRRLWVVSDTLVGRLYGREMLESLKNQGFQASLLTVARGERSKSWPVVARLTRQVLIDPDFLLTLPARERLSGMAEVVKTGFIRDAGLLELLAGPGRALFQDRQLRNRDFLAQIIARAAAIKAQIVAADERQGDLGRILNFGHTLGHALEKASQFRLKHGEAVAVGIVASLDFSVQLTGLSPSEARAGRELLPPWVCRCGRRSYPETRFGKLYK